MRCFLTTAAAFVLMTAPVLAGPAAIAPVPDVTSQPASAPLSAPPSAPVSTASDLKTNPNADKPVVITAKQTLEWHRNDNKYVARGDVVATQGDTSIDCDLLTADYRADEKSNNDIYQLTALGNVRVNGQGSVASGDKAVYDVDKGLAVMTGRHLTLTSPDQVVTARDRFEYWTGAGRLNAIGQVHTIHGEDTIDADTQSAIFLENPQTHAKELSRLEAEGHVVIVTPTEVLHGDRGTYEKGSNVANLYGHVTIKRGPNILEGDHADVDLNTNISRMHAGTGAQSRVRGVFYPGTQNGAPASALVSAKPVPASNPAPAAAPAAALPPAPALPAPPQAETPSPAPQQSIFTGGARSAPTDTTPVRVGPPRP